MTRSTPPATPLLLALGAPALLLLLAAAVLLGAAAAGYEPFAAPADLTLAEAAAISDGAEVLRQIRAGADPSARVLVRRGFVSDPEFLLTPLEAAIAADHPEIVRLLVQHGAAVDQATTPVLVCLAESSGSADILSFLKAHAAGGGSVRCDDVRLPL